MRILLLTDDRKTAAAYRKTAEEKGLRLDVVKNLPQALECLYRTPYDALISEECAVLHPAILARPVLWPNNLFLLLNEPLKAKRIPERLTYCFLRESDPSDVLSVVCKGYIGAEV